MFNKTDKPTHNPIVPKAPLKGARKNPTKLVLALRRLASGKQTNDKTRLRSCELLLLIDPTVEFNKGADASHVITETDLNPELVADLLAK